MSDSFMKRHLAYYRSQHTTMGCRMTHLLGVPMICLSIPMFFFDWKRALVLFSGGWFLQFIGHFVFEKNKPVLLSDNRHPYTLLSALIFVGTEWLGTARQASLRLNGKSGNNGSSG